MKRLRMGFAVGVAILAMHVAACDVSSAVDDWAAADGLARSTLEGLSSAGLAGIRGNLAAETSRHPGIEGEIRKMQAMLPAGVPDTVELVDSEVVLEGRNSTIQLRYVVRSASGAAQADVWVRREGGDLKVETLRVTRLPDP